MNPTLAPEEEAIPSGGGRSSSRSPRTGRRILLARGRVRRGDAHAVPRAGGERVAVVGVAGRGRWTGAAPRLRVHPLERDGLRRGRRGRHSGPGSSPRRSSRYGTDEQQRALPARPARRNHVLLARILRAGGRVGSRRRPHACGATGRRLYPQRREALDVRRSPRRLPVGAVPHRHDRGPQPRADVADRRSPVARHLDRADPVVSTASASTRCASTTSRFRTPTVSARRTAPGR